MLSASEKISFPIIAKLGGDEAVLDILGANSSGVRKNPRPTIHAIRYWKRKRVMPGAASRILMDECEQRGIAWSLADFKISEPEKEEVAA